MTLSREQHALRRKLIKEGKCNPKQAFHYVEQLALDQKRQKKERGKK